MIEKKGLTVDRLAMLLGKPGTDEIMLARIEFALDNAKEIALNYCHIKEIPEGLETTVLRMAMDIYRNEKARGGRCSPGGIVCPDGRYYDSIRCIVHQLFRQSYEEL